jgi:hypothetical protein
VSEAYHDFFRRIKNQMTPATAKPTAAIVNQDELEPPPVLPPTPWPIVTGANLVDIAPVADEAEPERDAEMSPTISSFVFAPIRQLLKKRLSRGQGSMADAQTAPMRVVREV